MSKKQTSQLTSPLEGTRYYPWFVIGLSAGFMIYKYILQVSPSIMTDDLMREFQITGLELGYLVATFFYAFLITQLFAGYWLDRYSPRYLTTTALILCGLGTLGFAQSETLMGAMAMRALMGAGAAFATVNYFKMASICFQPQKFAFISGLIATAAMIGAILGQLPLFWLVKRYSWRHALLLCSLAGFVIALLFYTVVRYIPGLGKTVQAQNEQISRSDFWKVITRSQNWVLTLYSGLTFAPIDAFAGLWGIPFLKEVYQLDQSQAATIIACLFIGFGIGSPLIGLWSDYWGKRRPIMLVGAVLSLVTLSGVLYGPLMSPVVVAGLLFIFGLATSAFMLGFAVGKELNPLGAAATIIALINTGNIMISAFTEPLIGALLDWKGTGSWLAGGRYFGADAFRQALTLLPLYLLLALGFLLLIKERK